IDRGDRLERDAMQALVALIAVALVNVRVAARGRGLTAHPLERPTLRRPLGVRPAAAADEEARERNPRSRHRGRTNTLAGPSASFPSEGVAGGAGSRQEATRRVPVPLRPGRLSAGILR